MYVKALASMQFINKSLTVLRIHTLEAQRNVKMRTWMSSGPGMHTEAVALRTVLAKITSLPAADNREVNTLNETHRGWCRAGDLQRPL